MYVNMETTNRRLSIIKRPFKFGRDRTQKSIGIKSWEYWRLYIQMGRWDDAEQHLIQAVEICCPLLLLPGRCVLVLLAWCTLSNPKWLWQKTYCGKGVFGRGISIRSTLSSCAKSRVLHIDGQVDAAESALIAKQIEINIFQVQI